MRPNPMRSESSRARVRAATLLLAIAASLPLHAWGDCGVDGTLIRDAAVRGLGNANNLINSSAADIMNGSRGRTNCIEHFGLVSIPPLGIPGVSAVISQLANNAMEQACQQAMGSASRYLNAATGGLTGQVSNLAGNFTSAFNGVQLPPLSSIGGVNTLGTTINGAVNGAINNTVNNAVNGVVNNVGNQINQTLPVIPTVPATTTSTPGPIDRMICWVSGKC